MREPSKIENRPATKEEKAELLAFMRDDLADDVGLIMHFLSITWDEFERLYATRGETRTFTATGETVGYCWVEHRGQELHLHAIFVRPEFRSQGFGTAILRGLEQEFQGKADIFELGVRISNGGARALYEREGFATVKRFDDIGFLVMRKQLGGPQ